MSNPIWLKSTTCDTSACVEVAGLVWRKSSYSAQESCLQVAAKWEVGHVLIRDSKDPDGPTLRFTHDEWNAFLKGVEDGEFDL
jgi:Domain of unknown function (DUF397).